LHQESFGQPDDSFVVCNLLQLTLAGYVMKFLSRIILTIDTVSELSAKVIIWLVLILTAVISYEIFSRYVLNAPTKWAFDLSYMIGGTFFMLGEAWTLKRKQHVRIDIFYGRFSAKTKAYINTACYLCFFFPLWGGILWALIPYVQFSWEIGERSMQGYWQPVIFPFKTIMPVAVALLLLQGVADVLRNIVVICEGEGK